MELLSGLSSRALSSLPHGSFFFLLLQLAHPPRSPHHSPFFPPPLSFHFPFLSPSDATFGMEKFSEFLGQAGCLVWLGDVLKAPWVCSWDVRSPGSIQCTSSLHWPFLREPTHSPMAKGSRLPPVNWGSMVAGAPLPLPLCH